MGKLRSVSFWATALICAIAADVFGQDAGTAFTYQGRLVKVGMAVDATCNFEFGLWDADVGGNPIGASPQSAPGVAVSDGLFTVILDFDTGAFDGDARWLEIAVQCPGDVSPIVLSPRQELTPAPYALALPGLYTEQNATSPNLIGGFNGNMAVTGVTGATVAGGGQSGAPNRVTDYFGAVGGGNGNLAGDDSGTTDDHGWATVGGGEGNTASGTKSTVGGGGDNVASSLGSTVSGGNINTASGNQSTVGGGGLNNANGGRAVVAGGYSNVASGTMATIGGGWSNSAGGELATVSGGVSNAANGIRSVVPGGENNSAGGTHSFAAGYYAVVRDTASVGGGDSDGDEGTFIWADATGAQSMTPFESTGPNQFLIRASGGVGIGTNTPTEELEVNGTARMTGFELPTGAAAGRVLTSDASGTGTWQALPAQPNDWTTTGNAGTNSAANFVGTTDNQALSMRTNSLTRMTIASGGNIGVGTAAPADLLDVAGTARMAGFRLTTSPAVGRVLTSDASGVGTWQALPAPSNVWNTTGNAGTNSSTNFLGTTDNQGLSLRTNSATRMTITSGGFVGIGTASPSGTLHVGSDSSPSSPGLMTALVSQIPGDSVALSLRRTGAAPILQFCTPGVTCNYMALNPTNGALHLGDNGGGGSPVMIVQPSGGNVAIGSQVPEGKLHVQTASGRGIYSRGDSSVTECVYGENFSGGVVYGVRGQNRTSTTGGGGVVGESFAGSGVNYGVRGYNNSASGFAGFFQNDGGGHAARFLGTVEIVGTLIKPGGSFRIDHPLDPANKYLYHSFVESPDMKNIYDGVVELDQRGEAEVVLPEWFEALNSDFRYQLTCIGRHAPVYVASEVSSNKFRIAGGRDGMKVSWQVTGIRQDAYAEAHRIPIEQEKPEADRGKYLFPELFGQPPSAKVGLPLDSSIQSNEVSESAAEASR